MLSLTYFSNYSKSSFFTQIFKIIICAVFENIVEECTATNWGLNRTRPILNNTLKIIAFLDHDPKTLALIAIGEKLRKYRKSYGVSQKKLAKQIGIDLTILSRLKRNEGRFFDTVFKKVHDFLNTQT